MTERIGDQPTSQPVSAESVASRLLLDAPSAAARALFIARLATAFYLVEVLLNLTRPRVLPNEPSLTIFIRLPGASGSFGRLLSTPKAVFWTLLVGIAVGIALQLFAATRRLEPRRAATLTWAAVAALVGPFALIPLTVFTSYPGTALACVPSSLFVLWLLHHGQRFARLPARALVAAFGWGSLIAYGFSRACSNLAAGTINGYLVKKESGSQLTSLLKAQYRLIDFLVLHLSIVNSLATAAGVLLLLTFLRHQVTDVVTGLALGAAVGLGFNFSESILLIRLFGSLSLINGATSGFEYWIRQSIGLLGGPVVFGALLGAALGLAAQARQRGQRALIAGAGLAAAIGGAEATETISAWLAHVTHRHNGGTLDTLVISPFLWLLVQLPFVALCVLLLRSGLRARAAAAHVSVAAEAGTGGAITEPEVPFLVDPSLRLWAVVSTWRRNGQAAAWALYRLQSAQLDVAGWRWQRQRAGLTDDPDDGRGERLRTKVTQLRKATSSTEASR